ncbi:MAG: hypothetical protein N2510_07755 [Ignavibacteria bacterium]|nr:hypothetical protein [Ignavibacteria bacterium]
MERRDLPHEISDYEKLLSEWAVIRKFRNKAAHTENLRREDFDCVYNAFRKLIANDYFRQFNDLKCRLKQ